MKFASLLQPGSWAAYIPWLAAVLFGLPALALFAVFSQPSIEIHELFLQVGRRMIAWGDIRRVDKTGWNVPLAVLLTLADGKRLLLIHAGDFDSSVSLLRHLRRFSHEALLDGISYRQFWGEPVRTPRQDPPPPRYSVLSAQEEEEVEQLFRRLKSDGTLDSHAHDAHHHQQSRADSGTPNE